MRREVGATRREFMFVEFVASSVSARSTATMSILPHANQPVKLTGDDPCRANPHFPQLTFEHLAPLAIGRDVPCPLCADRIGNPKKAVFRVWLQGDRASYFCARCNASGLARPEGAARLDHAELAQRMTKAREARAADARARTDKARWLFQQSQPARGTIVPVYMRHRGIDRCPDTLRFLPARGEHAPAMLAAFGMPAESVPGEYCLDPTGVRGIHITRLKPDGSDKAPDDKGREKIMRGPTMGWPIALIPPNDIGGLLVAEGIETALSFMHTGLGIWAAGSAPHLAALAPCIAGLAYVEALTIGADEDDHEEGRRCAVALANRLSVLRPDLEVRIWVTTQTTC
jgi:hypothetical protein